MKLLLCEYDDEDNECWGKAIFNKKRLIKASHILGVNNWKKFYKEEYCTDDVVSLMEEFDLHGWSYLFSGDEYLVNKYFLSNVDK